MGVTPSSVDNSLYERILDQLDDDMFYIFLIWNKRGERTIKIYDLAKNILFETADISVEILDDGTGLEQFLYDAKSMVQTKSSIVQHSVEDSTIENGGASKKRKKKKSNMADGLEDDDIYSFYNNTLDYRRGWNYYD